MNNRKLTHAVMMAALLMSLAACGIFKKGAKKNKSKKADTAATITPRDTAVKTAKTAPNPDMDKQLAKEYEPVWKKESSFTAFSGKAKCHYEGSGQNLDFTANIRMKKDEGVWIMVSALGGIVQVARVYATPDSFALINYLEKTYLSMKISEVNKVLPFPVDFTMLQNLLIGNALRTDGEIMDAKTMGDAAMLVVKKENLNQDMMISKATRTISSLRVYLDNDPSEATVALNNYKDIESRNFPTARVVNVSNKGERHLLEMNFTEAKFVSSVEMPFSVPKNYSQK